MLTVALVGAGSVSFTRTIVGDLLAQPETADCTLRLFDLDQRALAAAGSLVEQMQADRRSAGSVRRAGDLQECVRGADYVICTILVGGRKAAIADFEVTGRFGLRFTVGDTLGAAGIARAIRTIPALVEIARACESGAPRGMLLNYTNPMGMLVSAVGRRVGYPTVGLCHSAENTALDIARYLGEPAEALEWWSAGTNHLAWMLSLAVGGEDAYPRLASKAAEREVFSQDAVRFELMRHVGYFVTESSKHVAEYLGFFIDKPEEIERLSIPVGEFLRRRPVPLADQVAEGAGAGRAAHEKSNEYAPSLIAARAGRHDWAFQGNVMNDGLIDNVSREVCVEVPCVVSRGQVAPTRVGALPPAPAALVQQALAVQDLTVQAVTAHDRDLLLQAVMMDPQSAAVLSLTEMEQLVTALLEAAPDGEEYTSHRLWRFSPAGLGTS